MGKIVETKETQTGLKTGHPIAMSDVITQTQRGGLRKLRTSLEWMKMSLNPLNAIKLTYLLHASAYYFCLRCVLLLFWTVGL